MSCVPVRGCRIGEGRPKVILPIVERTESGKGRCVFHAVRRLCGMAC